MRFDDRTADREAHPHAFRLGRHERLSYSPALRMGIINGRELRVAPQFEFPLWGGCGPSKALCCAESNFRFRCYRNPINEKFIVNLMGGITVVVANSNGPIWPA